VAVSSTLSGRQTRRGATVSRSAGQYDYYRNAVPETARRVDWRR
jgi:hypothetical protein